MNRNRLSHWKSVSALTIVEERNLSKGNSATLSGLNLYPFHQLPPLVSLSFQSFQFFPLSFLLQPEFIPAHMMRYACARACVYVCVCVCTDVLSCALARARDCSEG